MKGFLIILFVSAVQCNPCSVKESLNITSGVLFSNGSVIHEGVEYSKSAWFEIEEDGSVVRLGCPCIGRVCLWRCCSEGQALYNRVCEDSGLDAVNPFSPPVYKGVNRVDVQAHDTFFYMSNRLCEDRYMVDPSWPNNEMYIQENGTLYEVNSGKHLWHIPTTYCVDMMTDANGTEEPRMIAAVCYPDDAELPDDSKTLYIVYTVGLLLSVPCLIATFLVYAIIPELRNLHGMCLMAYCAGMSVAYLSLGFLKLQYKDAVTSMTGCVVVAFVVYVSFQTSFFWLNVMCFDIWRTFSGYRGGSSNKQRDRRRFLLYGLYAWGVPLVLASCTVAMQFADLPPGILRPGFGTMKCWFEEWLGELVYFSLPIFILLVSNVVLFVVTSYRIRSIRQETAILKGSESARSDRFKRDKQRYGLYLKLFVVMGVNWSVEVISFMVGGSNWYWLITDITNVALGFLIFLIFVWKKRVRNLVAKRFRTMCGLPTSTPDARKSPWTSSSHTEDTRISASADDPSIRLKEIR